MMLAVFAIIFLLDMATAEPIKDQQPKRLYDFGLGKRAAYTYLSEYKRLPIYNFGLGKRSSEKNIYPLWIGKHENDIDWEYEDDDMKDDLKRMKQYSFGLGKRIPMKTYSFGLGKRTSYDYGDSFLDDNIEEDKRTNAGSNRFSFGLGKREELKQEIPGRRSMQYNFGLGKRNQLKQDDTSATVL